MTLLFAQCLPWCMLSLLIHSLPVFLRSILAITNYSSYFFKLHVPILWSPLLGKPFLLVQLEIAVIALESYILNFLSEDLSDSFPLIKWINTPFFFLFPSSAFHLLKFFALFSFLVSYQIIFH